MIVFIVDDEHLIASTLGLILKNERFDTRVFFDGETALLDACASKPDILLTDIAMPRMDGPTLARAVLKLHAECAILFFSAQASVDVFTFDHPASSWHFIAKPIHPSHLVQEINALCFTLASDAEQD